MPTGALLLLGGITKTRPFPVVEPFNLGSVGPLSVEPFDIIAPKALATSVELFWITSTASRVSVEPFDLGSKLAVCSTEPFDILSGTDALLPLTDLGDGLPEAATAQPIYGYWDTVDNIDENLGTIVTD